MSDSTTLSVPGAGWYPDRSDPRVTRWWDGQQWTDHTREVADPVAASVVQPVSASAFDLSSTDAAAAQPAAQPAAQSVAQPGVAQPSVAPAAPVVVVAAASSGVPAGWYADNTDAGLQRWWDGAQWTSHTAPRAAAETPATGAVTSPQTSAYQPEPSYGLTPGAMFATPAAVNSLATRGMIYSLISLLLNPLFIMSIGGLVNGIRALRRAPNFLPANARRGQATAAIVVGIVATLLSLVALVSAIQVYAATHGGN